MTQRYYDEESRKRWYTNGEIGNDQIKLGCLLRIAEATELMAKNHRRLLDERNYWERRAKEETAAAARLARSNVALRGVITKLKRAVEAKR